jgi:hypothetical protein
MKVHKPKTINEAIDVLHTFFEMDMFSKFMPKIKLGKHGTWYRTDYFKCEKDYQEYLDTHFKILKKDIRRLK